jgi:hypothetical protein
MRTKNKWITALGVTALVAAAVQLEPQEVTAADHNDAPLTMEDNAADIADVYAWTTANDTIVVVMTFAGLRAPGDEVPYDSDTLYTIHIDNTADQGEKLDFTDNDNDNESDIRINVRFGQNGLDEWGVQFNGVPGADDDTFDGPVQEAITNGGATVIAGNFDDPFFFDFEGFVMTRDNLLDPADPLDVAFAGATSEPVDAFAGTNVAGIVVEIPIGPTVDRNPDNFIQIWATTGVTP